MIRVAPALLYAGNRFRELGIRLDHRVFAFASAALLLVALTGALIPLADAWKRRIMPALQGTRTTKSSRWLAVLVIAQMALATGVTCSAALLWRSLQNVSAIRPAMEPDRKLLMVEGFWNSYRDSATRTAALAAHISALPGVEHVAWARRAMLSGSGRGLGVGVELPGQPKLSFYENDVSPDYFAATGAKVLAGREFPRFGRSQIYSRRHGERGFRPASAGGPSTRQVGEGEWRGAANCGNVRGWSFE